MMRWKTLGQVWICLLFVFSGCSRVGESRTEQKSIALDGAESVRAVLNMASGVLNVRGGAQSLMEGEFTYPSEALKPEIRYRIMDQQGSLVIRSSTGRGGMMGARVRSDWDLKFSGKTPIDFRFVLAEGAEGRFDLQALTLTKLFFDMTSGAVRANASGHQDSLTRLDIHTKSGDISLKLAGDYASLSRIKAISTSGDLTLDLTGTWQCDLDGMLRSDSGDIQLHLPGRTGVRAEISTRSGGVRAEGLRFEEGAYLNGAFGQSEATLRLEIFAGSGDIELRPAE
jgi:hypothetical protein